MRSKRGCFNFLKSMGIYQKIQNLFAQKQNIEKEIMGIQKSCKHFNDD